MRKLALVSDHSAEEYPGGAHYVNRNICEMLDIPFIKTESLEKIDPETIYLLANATFLPDSKKEEYTRLKNYCIFEHDYKIHPSRRPDLYEDCVFPKKELTNLNLFKSARCVFLQSRDHLECFNKNNIEGNLVNLSTSIWSDSELGLLEELSNSSCTRREFAIAYDPGPHKGLERSIGWCKVNNISFSLIPKTSLIEFYKTLTKYPALVFFPIVRESFSRLMVEARCLSLNLIAPKIGAASEDWFKLRGQELIEFLREGTQRALRTMVESIENV